MTIALARNVLLSDAEIRALVVFVKHGTVEHHVALDDAVRKLERELPEVRELRTALRAIPELR